MDVSFIIPAYNVGAWVIACLDSVYALGWPEAAFEVIVIDDSSTDDTWQLLQRYAATHGNLRLHRQAHQGQSCARNWGIRAARGNYIYFVDADDALPAGAVFPTELMATGRYDMIGVEVWRQDLQGRRLPYCRQQHPHGKEFARASDYLRGANVLGIVYGYLFRRAFLCDHDLFFTPGIYHQDEEFVTRAFCMAGPFVYWPVYTYIYIMRPGSSIHTFTVERRERLMNDSLTVIERLTALARRDAAVARILHYKLAYLAGDVLRLLVRQQHRPEFAVGVIGRLRACGLYPLPPLSSWRSEWRFRLLGWLTATPARLLWWMSHRRCSAWAGF